MKKKSPNYLFLLWIAATIIVVVITFGARRTSAGFQGIADSREIVINLEKPAEIQKIHVVPGQEIVSGDLLVELSQPDLILQINQISHQIQEIQAEQALSGKDFQSQIQQLRAQKEALASNIAYQIEQLNAEYKLNKELLSGLKSVENNNSAKGAAQSPTARKIESLEKELKLAVEPLDMKIKALQGDLSSTGNPFEIQLERLQNELALLSSEEKKLAIRAPIDGIVGSVGFKDGEKVSPFAPILTLHSRAPSYVRGYIHENAYNNVRIGQSAEITSLADSRNACIGKVVGVGSRIVEYPVRLRKRPDIQIWGREVHVMLPSDNKFLLGESVRLRAIADPRISAPRAILSTDDSSAASPDSGLRLPAAAER